MLSRSLLSWILLIHMNCHFYLQNELLRIMKYSNISKSFYSGVIFPADFIPKALPIVTGLFRGSGICHTNCLWQFISLIMFLHISIFGFVVYLQMSYILATEYAVCPSKQKNSQLQSQSTESTRYLSYLNFYSVCILYVYDECVNHQNNIRPCFNLSFTINLITLPFNK